MEKARVKQIYKELYSEVEEILFRNDPVRINFESNTDEYDPEVSTILPRLKDAKSEADVHFIVHDECVKWFGSIVAGDKSQQSYKDAAREIWDAWKKFNAKAEKQDASI